MYVCYDYTRMVVRELWSERRYFAEEDTAGPEIEEGANPPDMRDMAVDAEVCPVVSL